MERKSFIYHRMWWDMMKELPPEEVGKLFVSLCRYAFEDEHPSFDNPMEMACFSMMQKQLDRDADSYEKAKKRMSDGGKKGMENRWSDKRSDKDLIRSDKGVIRSDKVVKGGIRSVSVNVNDNVNDNVNENVKEERVQGEYQLIADLYNETCVSFPSVTSLSENRKKAIKARRKTYSIADFRKCFEKAEQSSFLKGGNDRNWSATFDWMIKDSNMAKILDGNYDNKERAVAKENHKKIDWSKV